MVLLVIGGLGTLLGFKIGFVGLLIVCGIMTLIGALMVWGEIPEPYKAQPPSDVSKIYTWQGGLSHSNADRMRETYNSQSPRDYIASNLHIPPRKNRFVQIYDSLTIPYRPNPGLSGEAWWDDATTTLLNAISDPVEYQDMAMLMVEAREMWRRKGSPEPVWTSAR
jgi:hypothetical protein